MVLTDEEKEWMRKVTDTLKELCDKTQTAYQADPKEEAILTKEIAKQVVGEEGISEK